MSEHYCVLWQMARTAQLTREWILHARADSLEMADDKRAISKGTTTNLSLSRFSH